MRLNEIHASHIVEHLHHPLPLFAEAWRIALPDAVMVVRCPYGSSDAADEDPTHVRRLFLNSWGYFSQPFYWRADYGYRGDWQPETITLKVSDPALAAMTDDELSMAVRYSRNVVAEMVVTLRAIKPARAADCDLQVAPQVRFVRVLKPGGQGMPKYVRAKGNLALIDKESGAVVVPQAGEMFEASHPLVKSHPGAFLTEEEAFSDQEAARLIPPTEVEVEQATAAPGERRGAKRK